jgi:predicted transcriptional regulator
MRDRGNKVEIILKKKTVEEVIGYWIEMEHIQRTIGSLVEYSDEVSEIYEYSDWLKCNVGTNGNTVIDVQNLLEQAEDKAYNVTSEAEDKLKTVLKAAMENKDEMFDRYGDVNLVDKIDTLMDYLQESFDDIYVYVQNQQIENFYKVMHRGIEEIFNFHCYDGMKIMDLIERLNARWNISSDERYKGEHPECSKIQEEIERRFKKMSDEEIKNILDRLPNEQLEQVLIVMEDLVDTRSFFEPYIDIANNIDY